jgi:hypothetical protein
MNAELDGLAVPLAGGVRTPVAEENTVKHWTMKELEAGLAEICRSPKDNGPVELICRRPQSGKRELLQEGHLDLMAGLVGDNWLTRGSPLTADGAPHADMQVTIMNSRMIALLAQDRQRWPLAGDQFYVDLDLSTANLPPGTRLALGSAVIEITAQPHTGCKKFVERYGLDAMKFVNSALGRQLNLRGINAKVVRPGTVRVGDLARKTSSLPEARSTFMGSAP